MNDAVPQSRPRGPQAGFSIGILTLDTCHPLVPGNVQNAATFQYPVRYETVRGVSAKALMSGDPAAAAAIILAARALEAAGVEAILGACGSFANYQSHVAAAVSVPVFMSILLEVPLLLRALPIERELGIVFASTSSWTDQVKAECGILHDARIVAIGADEIPAFAAILTQRGELNEAALVEGLVELTCNTMRAHPAIGMWLIQCSDLPPYAAAIQRATGLPVFDMVTLIDHVRAALKRRPFES